MKKWKLSLIGNVLAAAMLITSLPLNMLPVQAAEASGKEVESATVADWKLGENYAKEGTQIADGTLQMIDQSGNGNDLKMQFYDGKKVTESVPNADVLNENLHFSEETMNGSSDGSMEFDGNSESGKGADLVTVDDAPINQEKFENGYTIEFLYKFPEDWTDSDSWMGLMARQTSYTRNGDNYTFPVNSMDEPQLGSMSVAVSNCKEVQFLTAPAEDDHQMESAAWSVSMDKGNEWYHIAIVSDGQKIRTYVNGCEAFRDYESSDMIGMFADEKDGRFRIGSSWYVEKKGDWGYKELDKFLQGNLQEIRISNAALEQKDWLIPDPTRYAGNYGSNEAYQLKNEEDYNFVLLPDTQNTVKFKKDVMNTAIDELIRTADDLNVKGVIHLGDVVENNNDGTQYDTAKEVFYKLPDAGIRFLVQPGNHDGWASGTTNYWNSFGANSKIFADRTSWYLTNNGYSSYMLVNAGSYTYLVISLACTGSDPGRNNNTAWDASQESWFKQVLETYPNCPTIVTTHDLQNCSDTQPSAIKLSANGTKLWNLVKGYDQVFMMVGGHSHGAGIETLTNDNGKPVISILTDYQFAYNGGNGLFRYLEFDEKDNKIYYSAYSPYAASLSEEQKTFFDVNFLNGEGNTGNVDLNFKERFPGMEKEQQQATEGKWMSGEYHTHSGQSKDATENYMSLENVLGAAFKDKDILKKNQGSATKTDNITDENGFDYLSLADHLRKSYNGVDGKGNGNYTTPFYVAAQTQQREMEKLQAQGKYTDKLMYTATEWDMPGLDHATVGLIDSESDAVPYKGIHEFEWKYASAKDGDDPTSMFTETGNNYSGDFDEQAEWGDRKNQNNASSDVSAEAVKWVAENYPDSYVLPNHPSRHDNCDDTKDYGEVTVGELRKLNDAAPNVVFGMEGMPGNQMDPSCELPMSKLRAGADEIISVTGGAWDAMLSEGRKFYNFANSDFHFKVSSNENYSSGYWSGEFSKNYTWVMPGTDGKYTFKDVVAGLRSGNSYSVNGDLISDLSFTVSDKNKNAGMGSELAADKNDKVTVTVRFKVPEKNNYQTLYNTNTGISVSNKPEVDHVDLIAGHITEKVKEADYESTANTDAKIVKTFSKEEIKAAKGEDGYYTLTYTMKADADMYFRVRGLSSSEVDENGDPVTHERTITNDKPARFDYINDYNYSHLSFYANPVFVKVDGSVEKSILNVAYEAYKDLDLTAYTKESADAFSTALHSAEELIERGDASEEELRAAAEQLMKAAAGLIPDTKKLQDAADAAKNEADAAKKEADAAKDLAEAAKKAAEAAEAVSKEALKQASLNRQDAQEVRRLAAEAQKNMEEAKKNAETAKKAVFLAQKPELKSVKSKQAKKIQVKWQKIESAEGYEIQYAQNSKFKKAKKAIVKNAGTLQKKIAGLKKGKKYYVRVRAYSNLNGTKSYTDWSKKKTVRVK